MHCPECATKIVDDASFCSNCGEPLGGAPAGSKQTFAYPIPLKSVGFAVILSFLTTGLGQIYVEKISRGLGLMSFNVALAILFMITARGLRSSSTDLLVLLFVALCFTYFIIWIVNIFDAYSLARQYNVKLNETGQEPW